MKKLALALALSIALATPALAVTTTKIALIGTDWTDLGTGPLLLSFTGSAVFAVADVKPLAAALPLNEGFTILTGSSFRVETTSHVWAMWKGTAGAAAYVSQY